MGGTSTDDPWLDNIKVIMEDILSLMRQRYGLAQLKETQDEPVANESFKKEQRKKVEELVTEGYGLDRKDLQHQQMEPSIFKEEEKDTADLNGFEESNWCGVMIQSKRDESLMKCEWSTVATVRRAEEQRTERMKKRLEEMEVCREGLLEEIWVEEKHAMVPRGEEHRLKRKFMVGRMEEKQMEEKVLMSTKTDRQAVVGENGLKHVSPIRLLDQSTEARNWALKDARWASYTANFRRFSAQIHGSTRKPQKLNQYAAPMGVHSTQFKIGQLNSTTPEAKGTDFNSKSDPNQPRRNSEFKRRSPAEFQVNANKRSSFRCDEEYKSKRRWRFKQLRLLLMDDEEEEMNEMSSELDESVKVMKIKKNRKPEVDEQITMAEKVTLRGTPAEKALPREQKGYNRVDHHHGPSELLIFKEESTQQFGSA